MGSLRMGMRIEPRHGGRCRGSPASPWGRCQPQQQNLQCQASPGSSEATRGKVPRCAKMCQVFTEPPRISVPKRKWNNERDVRVRGRKLVQLMEFVSSMLSLASAELCTSTGRRSRRQRRNYPEKRKGFESCKTLAAHRKSDCSIELLPISGLYVVFLEGPGEFEIAIWTSAEGLTPVIARDLSLFLFFRKKRGVDMEKDMISESPERSTRIGFHISPAARYFCVSWKNSANCASCDQAGGEATKNPMVFMKCGKSNAVNNPQNHHKWI